LSCKNCEAAPYSKGQLGCEEPTQTPAYWFDEDEEWWNCPLRFIPQGIYEFLEIYDSYKAGLSAPLEYDKQSAKFNMAVRAFNSYMVQFSEEKSHGH